MSTVLCVPIVVVQGDDLQIEQTASPEDTGSVIVKMAVNQLEQAWRGDIRTREHPAASLPPTTSRAQISRVVSTRTTPPRILILHANGTNRDRDAYLACELAGAHRRLSMSAG